MKLCLREMSGTAVLPVAAAAGNLTCQAQLYYGSLFGVSLLGKIDSVYFKRLHENKHLKETAEHLFMRGM